MLDLAGADAVALRLSRRLDAAHEPGGASRPAAAAMRRAEGARTHGYCDREQGPGAFSDAGAILPGAPAP